MKNIDKSEMATYLPGFKEKFKQINDQIEDIHEAQRNSIKQVLEELTSKYKDLLDEEYDERNVSPKKRKINIKALKNRSRINAKRVIFFENASKYPILVESEDNEPNEDFNFVDSGDVTIPPRDSISSSSSFSLPLCNSTLLPPNEIEENENVVQNSTKKTYLRGKNTNQINAVRKLRSKNCTTSKDYPRATKSVERKIEITQKKKEVLPQTSVVQENRRNRNENDRKVKVQHQANFQKKEEKVRPAQEGKTILTAKTKKNQPVKTKKPNFKILTEKKKEILNYDIEYVSEDFSEDDHDDKTSKKLIPSWATEEKRESHLNIQASLNKSTTVYPWFNKDHLAAPSLNDLFSDILECCTRTSSAV